MTISFSVTNLRLLRSFGLLVLLVSVASTSAQVQINNFGPFKYKLEETFYPFIPLNWSRK